MSDGALKISILGDASQFKDTLADLETRLKNFRDKLKSAKGADIPALNFKIAGTETAIKEITQFGKFAQGSLGQLLQLQKELETKRLNIVDPAELTEVNKLLSQTVTTIKEYKSLGLDKPIELKIDPPPPGSIDDIKNKIKDIISTRGIKVGLDLSDSNISLKNLREELNRLESQGIEIPVEPVSPVLENSIQGIRNQIDKLKAEKVLINIDDKVGLATINKKIQDLTSNLTKAESVSFDKNGKITENSARANRALTSLSLVAQDLPFGFIAIQNNLPAVFETFSLLKRDSEGLKGALATLGSSLIGPAGLFLAFSIVTGAVTYAIKEYGSLSNAVAVLTGANSVAVKSQVAFNKALSEESGNIGGRIAQIKILVENYQRETSTQLERLAAFRALRDINPDIVAGIDEQNFSTAKSIDLVGKNAAAIINLLKVQAKQQAISKVLDDLEQKRFEANGKFNAEKKKQIDFENRLAAIDAKKAKGISLTSPERSLDAQRDNSVKSYAKNVNEARDAISLITTEQDKWYNSLKPLVTETSTANSAFETLIETLKDLRKGEKEAAKGTKELKEELQGVIPLFDLLLPSKEQFNFDFLKEFFGPNFIKQLKESQRKLNATQKELQKFREGDTFGFLPDQAPTFRPSDTFTKDLLNQKKLAKEFEDTKNVLNDVFFAPVSDLFQNFFDTGKFAFEEFGKAILNTIKSIVSKIIATGIINLLANILLPGGGRAANALGNAATGAGGGILGALKAAFNSVLGIGKISNPNFGGVQGGGMQLAGEVVFRQRGSDLIGVINRTNGTINRVG
jgi:hypothetical protein